MTSPEELEAKLQKTWLQVRPLMLHRLEVLKRAVEGLAAGTITANLCSEAIQEAHKLAGALGVFGLHAGSRCALKMEETFTAKASSTAMSLQFSAQEISAVEQWLETLDREIKSK